MEKENNNIELRSAEVQEILGHIPSSIIRYGIGIIITVVLVLFVGSFFFKYPDILTAPVEVVSENPPAAIVAKVSGNLTAIFVADSQRVVQYQKLAVIKNPAVISHVDGLKIKLQKFNQSNQGFSQVLDMVWPDTLVIGDIQPIYASFLKAVKDFQQFKQLNYYPEKILSLQNKQIELEKYAQIMERQVSLKKQDYKLAENQYLRDSGLFAKQVISLSDFEKSRQSLLQNSLSVENAKSVEVNTKIQLQDLQQQISDLKAEEIRQQQSFENVLAELLINLENSVTTWYDMYVLVSPIDGIMAFNKIWSSNQFVQAGEEVFTIIPAEKTKIIGRISLSAKGAGKVKANQNVNLKFDNFPYQEFGMVTAKVSAISLLPAEQNYMVEVNLCDTLITNYGYLLPFTQKMQGTAEIITEDLPLIVRLFNPLKSILKKHWNTNQVRKIADNKKKEQLPEIKNTALHVKEVDLEQNNTMDTTAKNTVKTLTTPANHGSTAGKYQVYHVIGGSFSDAAKAEKVINKFEIKGYKCRLLADQNHYRISLFSTFNREKAFLELDSIRKAEKDDNIWVLKLDNETEIP